MSDRLIEVLYQKVIEIVGKLPVSELANICNGKLDAISGQLKATGLNPNNHFEKEILLRYARLGLEDALKFDAVEFNGIYFEKEAPFDSNGNKRLYSYENSIKRVNSLGFRHAYPSEAFSLIIAWLEGKLNFEQKAAADDMQSRYGEWFGAEIERKGDRLIVYLENSDSMEFDLNGIPSLRFVDLCRFPEEFAIKMYSRRFEDLPQEMREGSKRAQVYLPLDGIKWPLGRGNFYVYYVNGYDYDVGASRWVAVGAKNFSIGNGGKK